MFKTGNRGELTPIFNNESVPSTAGRPGQNPGQVLADGRAKPPLEAIRQGALELGAKIHREATGLPEPSPDPKPPKSPEPGR